jgi:hypothetical protein
MNTEIRKYEIRIPDFKLAIPQGSKLLDLQMQNGIPVMWWDCPLNQDPLNHTLFTFVVVPTGPPGKDERLTGYLGTFQDGGFVGHVYIANETPID